tara:strand:+ start:5034 stop:5570 length:537 start_codon:yes stop_codon:yes gene_type:complete
MDKITKPLCAHQYYMKAWKFLTDEEKLPFVEKATKDKERYVQEKKVLDDIEKEKTKKLEIFISRSYGRVPCIGMDNGWSNYEVIGPAEKVSYFTEKEKKIFFDENNRLPPKYKELVIAGFSYKVDIKRAKKYSCPFYGFEKWTICDEKKQEHYTITYNHNMCGDKTWRTEKPKSHYSV